MRWLTRVMSGSGETLKLYLASLALIALLIMCAAVLLQPVVISISEHNAPCESPAFGPPGGCLLPGPNER